MLEQSDETSRDFAEIVKERTAQSPQRSAAKATKVSRAAATASARSAERTRSFGACMFESGTAKPVTIAGSGALEERHHRAATPGAQEERLAADRPLERGARQAMGGEARRRRPGLQAETTVTRASPPSGMPRRSSRSTTAASPRHPGRAPDASRGSLSPRRRRSSSAVPASRPRRRSRRATGAPTCGDRTRRPQRPCRGRALVVEQRGARRKAPPVSTSSAVGGSRRPAALVELDLVDRSRPSARCSTCSAFSAAPP